MSQFTYTVWPVPGISGTYAKKIAALRPDSASGTLYRRQSGRGNLTIPAGYDRLDEIITVDPSNHANDVASLIRVYRGSDLIQELLVPVTPNLVADQPAALSCEGVEAVMDWAVVECWDWDGTADFTSTVPDWIYGGRNLIPDLALGDLGSIREQWELWNDQTPGGTFVLRVTEPAGNPQDTNSLNFDATIQQIEGSNLTGNGLEGLSNVNDVTISGSGQSNDDPWVITFFDPPIIDNLQVFDSGSLTSALSQTQAGMLDPSPVTVSQSVDASRNPNTHGTYTDPPIEVVTTPLDTGTDWSLLVNATGQFAGSQIVLNGVTPGQTYQASIRVRPTITSDFTLVIHDQFENRIKTTTPRDNTLTAGSFQELSISDIQIPEGVTRIIMRVAVVDGTPANIGDFYVNWQGAEFREGQAATTAGQVLLDLLADAQTDHASGGFPRTTLDFVNAGFDATNDSGSAAWADSELSINIPRGMTYRKVLDRVFGQLGYEWNLTPTSGTPGEWDLNVWNPDGRGTDWSSADTPSLLLGQGTLGGSATRQVPQANRIISEGAGQFTTRARNTASEGTIGSREWYQADVSYAGSQAEAWTDKTLSRFLDVSLQPRFEIADPPDTEWPIPVVDYGLADVLNVDLADGAGKVSRTVEAISWRTVADGVRWGVHTGEAQFDAFPSGGGSGGFLGGTGGGEGGRGAVAVAPQRASVALSGPVDEGVRRLLDQFDRQQFAPTASAFVPSGGGGAPTVVVAASDATEISKRKADYICNGTNDEVVIQEAIDSLGMISRPGRVLLTEGVFNVVAAASNAAFRARSATIEGMGPGSTSIVCSGGSGSVTIWTQGGDNDIRNLSIFSNSSSGVFTDGAVTARIVNCDINVSDRAVWLQGGGSLVVDSCYLDGAPAIFMASGPYAARIVNNLVEAQGDFLVGDGSTDNDQLIVANNVVFADEGIFGLYAEQTLIQDNHIFVRGRGIELIATSAGYSVIVTGNNVDGGNIYIEGTDFDILYGGVIVANNAVIPLSTTHGIHLNNCVRVSVHHNHVSSEFDGEDNTHDGIFVEGDSDRNHIEANYIHGNNVLRYGINISAGTCDCNIVVGNVLGDSADYETAPISDAGIDTQWKYPDDPVYGDNFVDCETPSS